MGVRRTFPVAEGTLYANEYDREDPAWIMETVDHVRDKT